MLYWFIILIDTLDSSSLLFRLDDLDSARGNRHQDLTVNAHTLLLPHVAKQTILVAFGSFSITFNPTNVNTPVNNYSL